MSWVKNMNRKLVGVMLIALLMMTFGFNYADAEVYGAFEYVINPDGTVSITGYTEEASSIIIPDAIEGLPVVSVSFSSASTHQLLYKSLKEVTIPQSVTRLDVGAFNGLAAITKINGLEHLTYVDTMALTNTSITEAVFGENLTFLGSQALAWTDVTRVVIPDNIDLISSAFQETYYLENIELIETDTPRYVVREGALYNMDMTVLYTAFGGYGNTFVVPESVITICDEAFGVSGDGQFGIQDVHLGENVTDIATYAFRDWNSGELPTLHVVENSAAYEFAVKNGRAYVVIGSEKDIDLQEKIESVIAQCITENMSEYEKAKALHDWICDNVEYDYSLNRYSARSALIDGLAVCQGYSYAYMHLLSAIGIENHCVPNLMIDHVWNLAKLDGLWTYIDCTWSDTTGSEDYFAFNSDICYMTHGGLKNTSWGDADSLAMYTPYLAGNYENVVAAVKSQIQNYIDNGETSFTISGYYDGSYCDNTTLGVLMTVLRESSWESNGITYKVQLQGDYDGVKIDCIIYENDENVGTEALDFKISLNSDGICIDAYTGMEEFLVIPDTLFGYPVVRIGYRAFAYMESLRGITVPDSVIEIGKSAFAGCIRLSKVTLGDNIVTFGDSAFWNCVSLEEIELPEGLTSLGRSTFSYTGISEIVIPQGISDIPDYCFNGSKLGNIVFAGNLRTIGDDAFAQCRLSAFECPEGLQSIGDSAFWLNTKLTSFTVPATVTSVGKACFSGCTELKSFTNYADPSVLIWIDGILLTDNGKILNSVMPWVEELVVPDSVLEISEFAAKDSTALKSVFMGNQVTEIGEHAFSGCIALKSIVFSDNIEVFPDFVLWGSYSISSVHWPANLKTISDGSIIVGEDFVTLPEITSIPDGSITIYNSKRMVIPDSVTQIEASGIMVHCDMEIWIPDSVTDIENGCFQGLGALTIVCNQGSAAEQYAINTGTAYIAFPKISHESILLDTCGAMLRIDYDGLQEYSVLEWWSTDESVVKVVEGQILKTGTGQAEIHVRVENMELVCEISVTEENVSHTETIDAAVLPTCTETGLTDGKHCSVCNEILTAQVVVPALGHTEVIDNAVLPTCTEAGLTEGSHCSVCGGIFVEQQTVDALGHDEVIDLAFPATYISTGLTEGMHCARCSEVFVAQYVMPVVDKPLCITLPASLETIDEQAFEDCAFECVIVNEECTIICAGAFEGNEALRFVEIPASVKQIDATAFKDCNKDIVIITAKGSTAEAYAAEHSIFCVTR